MTGATVCSGIGAPEAAMLWINWRWCAEVEKFPSAVLAARHGHPNLGDITAPDFIERATALGPVDLLVAGTPCQAFSVAGLRRSLDDDRGNLTLRFVEIVNAIEPRFTLWENVPGVLSTRDNAFGCFLAGMVGADSPLVPARGQRWTDAGVVAGPKGNAAWRVLDAQYFNLAQRRERVFVVRCPRNGADPAEVLFEREGVQRHFAPRREAREGIAGTLSARTKGGGGLGTDFDLAGGLVSKCLNGGAMRRIDAGSETLIAGTIAASGAGTQRPAGQCNEPDFLIAHALRAEGHDASEDGTGRGVPLVPMGFYANDSGNDAGENLSPTLRAMPGGGGNHPAVAFALGSHAGCADGDQTNRSHDSGGPVGLGVSEELSYSLRNGRTQAVAFTLHGSDKTVSTATETELAGSLRTKPPGSIENSSTTVAVSNWAVRRLTVAECEKLQGFEPGYTQVEYRGKPAADGPRYRALGNSMAVPVIAWIGRRILEAERTR